MWQNLADFHFWKLEFWNTCWQLSDILGTPYELSDILGTPYELSDILGTPYELSDILGTPYELEITASFGFLEPDNVTSNALQFVSLDHI